MSSYLKPKEHKVVWKLLGPRDTQSLRRWFLYVEECLEFVILRGQFEMLVGTSHVSAQSLAMAIQLVPSGRDVLRAKPLDDWREHVT